MEKIFLDLIFKNDKFKIRNPEKNDKIKKILINILIKEYPYYFVWNTLMLL